MRVAIPALLFALTSAFAANPPVTFTFNGGPSCFGQCLGGAMQIRATVVDAAGNMYLTGNTNGTIPVTPNALQPTRTVSSCNGPPMTLPACNDAFVIKLDASGNVLYATYLGGDGDDLGLSIALDADGNIFVAGSSGYNLQLANNFPTTAGAAFPSAPHGRSVGFLVKLSSDGKLVYSTLLPGALESSNVVALAIDSGHNAYLAYQSDPALLIATTPGAFQSKPQNVSGSGVVLKLNSSGSAVLYATYLSGSGQKGTQDFPMSVALDPTGSLFIVGYTSAANFPVTSGAFQTKNPDPEYVGFLSKLSADGTGLVYSTYLGGGQYDQALAVKIDGHGEAHVLGSTNSQNFPVADNVFAFTPNCGFLVHLSADGSSIIHATFLPPASAFDLDSLGNTYVVGTDRTKPNPPYVARITSSGLSGIEVFGGLAPRVFSQIDTDTADFVSVAPNGSVVMGGSSIWGSFPGIPPPTTNQPVAYATSFFINPTLMNAASFVSGTIAPGELVAIRGYGFPLPIGQTTPIDSTGLLPTTFSGLTVFFDEISAPLLYVQSQQINAQVPWEIAGRSSVQVRIHLSLGDLQNDVEIGPFPNPVAPSAPGIFTINNSNATRNSPENPSQPGDFVTIYGTGGGLNDIADISGGFWPLTTPFPKLTSKVLVAIGNQTEDVLYAGASPSSPSGVFQINLRVPASLPAGSYPFVLTIGDASTHAGSLTIARGH